MTTKRQKFAATVGLGIGFLLLFPLISTAANDLAAINGRVRDSSGVPVVGALVIVASESPIIPDRLTFTDKNGSFEVLNLFAGDYTVKVTMPRFLPATKQAMQRKKVRPTLVTGKLHRHQDASRRAPTRQQSQSLTTD